METTKQKIVGSLLRRLGAEIVKQNPVKFLSAEDINIEIVADISISSLYLYTRTGKGSKKKSLYLSDIVSAIGHAVRNKFKLKRDSAIAAKAGAFILYSFEEQGIIQVALGRADSGKNAGHGQYVVNVLNEDAMSQMWDTLSLNRTEKLPSLTPYAAWTSTRHDTGAIMVKTANRDVLKYLTPETHPLVYNTLNRAQVTGWLINDDIYPIYVWALRNRTDAFAEIWEMYNPEAKQSKIREAKAIGSIAKRFIGKTFYHLYYFDFRGRKYPATAYLHEQGSDLAKGLLLRSDCKAIGEQGFFWLLIAIANSWAGDAGRDDGYKTDKIPLNDRVQWSLDNEEILISYAASPKVNQGWMKADKPWCFLAACNELYKARQWASFGDRDIFEYKSYIECYIDGSNNGSQHLSALTRDEITAPHVNLIPSELPGDLYRYVADSVWNCLTTKIKLLNIKEVHFCNQLIDTILELKIQIAAAPQGSDKRKELIDDINKLKSENTYLLDIAGLVFWTRLIDNKNRRKVVKRNVMTLPYGGTAYGLGQQQIDDARKHGIPLLFAMEHKWGSFIGREIYEDCKLSLKRPMQLLSVFENAGRKKENRVKEYEQQVSAFKAKKSDFLPIPLTESDMFLSWKLPITDFPVVQHYTEGTVKKIYVQYGPPLGARNTTGYFQNTYQLAICFLEDSKPSQKKQSQGASPNAIHSLDAAHLMITINKCNFPVTTIHDSYGCLLGDMAELFVVVRESFIELYNANPLEQLMKDIDGNLDGIELGSLDLNLVLDSEYCFA